MQAEIVTIGTELLLGEIVDTNSAWIAQQLTTIGLNLFYTTTVGDNLDRMTDVLRQAIERSEVVITTGGLGPTVDDMTREAVAASTERELEMSQELIDEITAYFAKRGYSMTDNNMRQARLPKDAMIIHNPVGTAPCFAVEYQGHVMISLPGVPHEMKYLMENEVLPYLTERYGLKGSIVSRTLRTCGIGESAVDSQIGDLMQLSNPTVGTRAHPGQTDLKITAKADSVEEAWALIEPVEQDLRERLGLYVFGVDDQTLADVTSELLAARDMRLALVESTTRGEAAQRFSGASQGPAAFGGSAIVSSADTLVEALDVDPALCAEYGYASQVVADAAAQAIRKRQGADFGLAIIGPFQLGIDDAPPVFFSLATADGCIHCEPRKGRSGPSGRGWLIHLALDLVRRHLLQD